MDLPVNHFKRALASGKAPVGTWLMSGAPATAEALGCAGFDFLVVDMEHVPIDVAEMIALLRTIAGTPAQAIVRPPWNDNVMVKRAMDAGAISLLGLTALGGQGEPLRTRPAARCLWEGHRVPRSARA